LPVQDISALKQNLRRADAIAKRIKELNDLYQKFNECSATINKVDDLAKKDAAFAGSVKDFHSQFRTKYETLERNLTGRPDGLFVKINNYRILSNATKQLTADEENTISLATGSLEEAIKSLNGFLNTDWAGYQKNLSGKQVLLDDIIK
jgi:hypothetical protein